MICDFLKWGAFIIYYGFKSHVNVSEGPKTFVEESSIVGKEETDTIVFNQAYDEFQTN